MMSFSGKVYKIVKKILPHRIAVQVKKRAMPIIQKLESKLSRKPYFYEEHYLIKKTKKGQKGCTLIGYPRSESGLGQHIRYVSLAFIASKIPFSIYDFSEISQQTLRENHLSQYSDNQDNYKCCIIADSVLFPIIERKDAYHIFYGYWELNDLDFSLLPKFHFMDEIWAPTRYIQDAISKKSVLPVIHMPIPIHVESPNFATKKAFGLPENKFTMLFSFDFSSTSKRKNPWAILKAFRRAFSDSDSVHLVIKCFTNQLNHEIGVYHQLKEAIDPSKMTLVFENFERERMNALISACDCYISLHRAEGFGLGMAEAMFLGKPVIGTNFSGNTDFMNAENSCLVDYRLVKVEKGDYLGLEGNSYWAEPDIEHASFYLRKLYEDAEYRRSIGQKAAHYIRENYNPIVVGKKYYERLKLLNLI